ncbi:MAG TPA: hypothetical protein VH227_01645 [Candidatus Udaeobacter sp.]|jgi:hypothetical protein|nr:hypothetical protein [Candidatus Udaeobacter sp.]
MRDKKKTNITVRDLKPKKDAKGGFTHQGNQGTKAPTNIRSAGGGHSVNKVAGP